MLELQTFGGLELRTEAGEGVEALAGRTKCLALLAYLAVEAPDGHVPREQVAALLWPGGTDERARASLRAALSQIRQATGPVLVAGEGTSRVGLVRDHLRADVTVFREALAAGEEARALEIYGGDFLAGVRVQGAGRFQRWADRQRGHLRQQAYEAALSVGAAARATDDLAAAEAAYRRALDLAPLREEAAEKLLRTLADRGRAADAVQLYEAFRARREAELEMAPSEELDAWVEGLKQAPPAAFGATEEGDPAEEVPGPEAGGSSEEALEVRPSPDTDVPVGATASRWARFRRRTLLGALAAVGLVSAALAGAWYLVGPGGEAAAVAAGDRSVAVLPFEATGTEDPGPTAAGLQSDLLTRLSAVGDLKVISATSVERFREADLPLPAIADSLGVTWVLEGHVQRAGEGIEVHAQLIDPRTDTHAWAETYRRELTAENLFELQGDITRRIVESLETRLTGVEEDRLDRRATGSLQAHRFYVRGRSLLEQREVPYIRRSLDYFEQALAEDSSYALAWAGIADALSLVPYRDRGGTNPDTLLPRAREAALRALEIAPDLAEGHVARGRLHMYRREGPLALRDFRRAIELKPSLAAAHAWLAKLWLSLGYPGEALEAAQRSVELDPLSEENLATLCWTLLATDRPERALEVVDRIVRLRDPGGSAPLYRVMVLAHLDRLDEMGRTIEEWGVPKQVIPFAATHQAVTGNPAAAERLLAEAGPETPLLTLLALHSSLGQRDRAFEILGDAYPREDRLWDVDLTIVIRYFFPATFRPLREDPRFEAYLEEVHTHWGLDPDGSLPEDARG